MTRRGLSVGRWAIGVLAAALVAAGSAPPAGAQEPVVNITAVTFDRFGELTDSHAPRIGVWITCDATGIIGDLVIDVEQRGTGAFTNSDLLDADCTTVPTRYILHLEAFGAVFKPGPIQVIRATEVGSFFEEFATGQRIILRPNKPLA